MPKKPVAVDDYPDHLRHKKRPSRVPGCIGAGCGLPLLVVMFLGGLYLLRNRPVTLTIPTPIVPANNAYDDFLSAGQIAKSVGHPPPASLPEAQRAQAETLPYLKLFAKDIAPAFEILHKAMPKAYLTPPVRSISTTFRGFADIRELARATSGMALYYEKSGQPGKAADVLLDGLEMGGKLPHGGSLIAGLVGLSIQAIVAKPLDRLIPQLSPTDLARVARRLDTIIANQTPYSDVVEEEGNASTAMCLEIIQHSRGGSLGTFTAFAAGNVPDGNGAQAFLKGLQFAYADKAAILRANQRYFQNIAAEARQPFTGPSRVSLPNNIIAKLLLPEFSQARQKFVGTETALQLLRIETALYQYRAINNRFPASLTDLTRTQATDGKPLLAAISPDPFGNAAFHYAPTNNGQSFQLYSIGANLRDDQGLPTRSPGDNVQGDIVAGRMWLSKAEVKKYGAKLPNNDSGS